MLKKSHRLLLLPFFFTFTLLFFQPPSYASAFLPQEARGLAMGGVGVAAADSGQAHYYNPSLLASARKNEDFNFEIDATLRITDNNQLIEAVYDFAEQDLYTTFFTDLADLSKNIANALNNGSTPTNIALVNTSQQKTVISARNLNRGINSISGKSLTADSNAGIVASVPDRNLGWAAYWNNWTNLEAHGSLSNNDTTVMNNIVSALEPSTSSSIDFQTLQNQIANVTLDSTISLKGALFMEFGVSLARKSDPKSYSLDVGITPKYQHVIAFDYIKELNELDDEGGEIIDLDRRREYDTFNLDFGVSKQLSRNWKTGITVKNLIPKSFKTPSGENIKLSPSARFGASFFTDWVTIGTDLDLTDNQDVSTNNKSRFLAFGAEFDVWLLQLRAGYRMNLSTENSNIPSLGIGLYLFGLNIDAAVAAKQTTDITEVRDVSAALQLGINW